MKFHIFFTLAIIALFGNFVTVSAQVDSVIGQLTSSTSESFAGGISGDGRLVVFESTGNMATENPRNEDGNREIFIFDYAQRRIFQITDTKSLRTDVTMGFTFANTRVSIVNARPVISNDGLWIAFSSNATTSTPAMPNATNPGSFNAESFNPVAPATTPENPLISDGNTEMWLYQIPAVAPADLTSGAEIAFTDLSAGTFTRVTNTAPSRLPTAGSATVLPVIGDDNRDPSINDNGNYIAFVSNRDLVPTVGNASPNANDEIFTYVRNSAALNQITVTARGSIVDPIYNQTPTISGNGLRIVFQSNADNPIRLMTTAANGGGNTDRNVEIFFADLDATGNTTATSIKRQITNTTRVNLGDLVNILDIGRRMSRDGRYIAFDSYADLANENSGANQPGFALYVFDANVAAPMNPFRRVGPRSDADTATNGGDVPHYPGFTDTNANGSPATLVLETRQNILANGTVAPDNNSGLNPDQNRPTQIYSFPLNAAPASATFTRLTKFPSPNSFIAATQPIPSDSRQRMTFNLALTEIGTGNDDLQSEAFYFLLPAETSQNNATLSFATGASRIPVSASPVPTPTATPTPSPSPSVSPTPQTPIAVQGVSPGMLAVLTFPLDPGNPIDTQTAVGSLSRRFTLPIQLNGVTLTINGAAAGIQSVNQRQVVFVVPPGLAAVNNAATVYPVVLNNNGTVYRGSVTIVPTRPDIFTFAPTATSVNRARIFNVTNTVPRTEPFNVTTLKLRGSRRVPTVLRVFLTGVNNAAPANITILVGGTTLTGAQITSAAILREPGVYSIDFTLPPTLLGAGDVPITVTITVNGVTYQSRLADTAPRFRIL